MTMGDAALRIKGLRELQASLKAIDGESQKTLRLVLNEAATIVVKVAGPRVPVKSGNARATLKVASSQREARVKGGSAKAPYFGWLDYGGGVGRGKSVRRPFVKEGRIVYPAYHAQKANIDRLLAERLDDLITTHGLEVT